MPSPSFLIPRLGLYLLSGWIIYMLGAVLCILHIAGARAGVYLLGISYASDVSAVATLLLLERLILCSGVAVRAFLPAHGVGAARRTRLLLVFAGQIVFLSALGLVLLPLLLGLTLELLFLLPVKTRFESSPIYNLWAVWIAGLMVLRLCYHVVLAFPDGFWPKRKIQEVMVNGVANFNARTVFDCEYKSECEWECASE